MNAIIVSCSYYLFKASDAIYLFAARSVLNDEPF